MASRPWWQFPITQGFNPPVEFGEDIGTPFHTPLTAITGGVVTGTRYGPFGGEVDIATRLPGSSQQYTETFLHLDEIAPGLTPGKTVQPGDFLGLSGGQNAGGSHPASPAYSSGPHTEVDFFLGNAWSGRSVDPGSLIAAGAPTVQASPLGDLGQLIGQGAGSLVNLAGPGGLQLPIGNPLAGVGAGLGYGLGSVAASINSLPNAVFSGMAEFFSTTEQNIAEWLKRQSVAFFVAAVVLLVLFL